MSVPEPLLDAVRRAESFVCATHSPMDGDGIGCGLAMQRALRAAGKSCEFVTEAFLPQAYAFLPGYDGIVELRNDPPPPCDLILGLDAGEPERLGRVYSDRAPGTKVANIDHHVSNPGFGDVVWVDTDAAATGEQVFLLLSALELEIDQVSAQCLLVSIATDTGRFCYSSTTPRTHEIAAALIRLGADPDGLQRHLYGARPLAVLKLRAQALDALRFLAGGQVSTLAVSHEFGADLGLGPEQVKDLVDLAIGVDGVMVAALIRGLDDGGSKVSLRSKSDRANVAALAAEHGGGGHVRAAGFTSNAGPTETERILQPGLKALAVAASR